MLLEGKGSLGAAADSQIQAELGKLVNVPHRCLSSSGQGYRAEQQLYPGE